jgi:ABC-2 type transport system permease protein
MVYGLMTKTIREILVMTLVLCVCLFAFHLLLAIIAPKIITELADSFLKSAFLKTIIQGLFGDNVGQSLGTAAITALAWIHPVPLIMVWGHAVVFWARIPAGEIERGTIDVLLSQPVSRFHVVISDSMVFLLSGFFLIIAAVLGNQTGGLFIDPVNRLGLIPLIRTASNLYCLYLSVGALSFMISSMCNTRAVSIGITSFIIALTYLIHTLVPFWRAVKQIAFLSIMDYYEPLVIIRGSTWPMYDMCVLICLSILLWIVGTVIFTSRNISTV